MSGAPDEARGARRLLIVVLLAAGCGGVLAGVLAVVQDHPDRALPTTAAARVFPESFRQAGFLSGQVRLTRGYVAAPAARTVAGRLDLATGSTAYIVARCSAGRITVRLGAASTTQRCRDRADGVIALRITAATRIRASVDRRQGSPWGVAVYR